jgi:signal transduction histidine kinase
LFFTTRPGGSGIGLANTFRFVQIHNGQIEFESELGRGTTFRIHLPLARALEPAGKLRDFSQPFAEEKR